MSRHGNYPNPELNSHRKELVYLLRNKSLINKRIDSIKKSLSESEVKEANLEFLEWESGFNNHNLGL